MCGCAVVGVWARACVGGCSCGERVRVGVRLAFCGKRAVGVRVLFGGSEAVGVEVCVCVWIFLMK